jgi:hypothetical protein
LEIFGDFLVGVWLKRRGIAMFPDQLASGPVIVSFEEFLKEVESVVKSIFFLGVSLDLRRGGVSFNLDFLNFKVQNDYPVRRRNDSSIDFFLKRRFKNFSNLFEFNILLQIATVKLLIIGHRFKRSANEKHALGVFDVPDLLSSEQVISSEVST